LKFTNDNVKLINYGIKFINDNPKFIQPDPKLTNCGLEFTPFELKFINYASKFLPFGIKFVPSAVKVVMIVANGTSFERPVRIRFRAVMMTALSFAAGMLPMVAATGAGAGGRRSIGMTTFWGMIAAQECARCS
jgi:hypothetical protein